MNVTISLADPQHLPTQALIIGCFEEEPGPQAALFDPLLDGAISTLYRQEEFQGKFKTVKVLHTLGRLPAERLLLVGLGKKSDMTLERLRQGGGCAIAALQPLAVAGAASLLHLAMVDTGRVGVALEGFLLAAYRFDRYQTKKEENGGVREMTILCSPEEEPLAAEQVRESQILCQAVCQVRDLVNEPGNVATPSYLAEQARQLAATVGCSCTIIDRDELERLGAGGILAVGKGSHHPPCLVELTYQGGGEEARPLLLIGKGITFDSGGISLKPREGMERMKDDMAGAAAVLGVVRAVAELKLPINLVALLPLAENLPGGGAYKPGDILRTMAGTTVEVNNTDAEGRLVLADALHYGRRFNPAAIIDIATLTGACLVALGTLATGIMGNDQALVDRLLRSGETSGERLWQLPLWDEYGEAMKSDIADMKNAGGPHAGTITAGWFLQQFVDEGVPWVHLDIAGTAWEEKGRPYLPKGASGVGVRLLVEFIRQGG
jgi:leucyl aminopeptidase